MSETYKQASEATPDQFEDDPENRLLARGSRFRMDSEMIRDQMLATSGLLNDDCMARASNRRSQRALENGEHAQFLSPRLRTGYGRQDLSPQRLHVLETRHAATADDHPQCAVPGSLHRSPRTHQHPAPGAAADERTGVSEGGPAPRPTDDLGPSLDPAERLAVLYETITSKLPDADETEAFLKMVNDLEAIYRDNSDLADQLCEGVQLHERSLSVGTGRLDDAGQHHLQSRHHEDARMRPRQPS